MNIYFTIKKSDVPTQLINTLESLSPSKIYNSNPETSETYLNICYEALYDEHIEIRYYPDVDPINEINIKEVKLTLAQLKTIAVMWMTDISIVIMHLKELGAHLIDKEKE